VTPSQGGGEQSAAMRISSLALPASIMDADYHAIISADVTPGKQ
jgi:hypothetical protein